MGLWIRIMTKSLVLAPKKHNNPITAGLPLAGAGYPHFIYVPAIVNIRLSCLKLVYYLQQRLVADTFFSGKSGKPRILENPHIYIIPHIVAKNKPDYTGIIVVSFQGKSTYFLDTGIFREKKSPKTSCPTW